MATPTQNKTTKRQFTVEQKITILADAEKEGFPVVARREKVHVNMLYLWRSSFPAYRELLHIRKQLDKIDYQLELNQTISKKLKEDVEKGKEMESYNATSSISHLANSLSKLTDLKSSLMKRQQELLSPAEEQEDKPQDNQDKALQQLVQILLGEMTRQHELAKAQAS